MEREAVGDFATGDLTFRDGLGERRCIVDAKNGTIQELLVISPELTAIPSFLPALRERARRLAAFRHPGYARVRRVVRLNQGAGPVGVISEYVIGVRMSDLLARSTAPGVDHDLAVV